MSNSIIHIKGKGNVVFPLVASKNTYIEHEKLYVGEEQLKEIAINPFCTPSAKDSTYAEIGRRRAWFYSLVEAELPHLLDGVTIEP
jgi:hypothetical protein